MANLGNEAITTLDDLKRFETEMTLSERLPERSILDLFIASADARPDSTAITMLMTGAEDEQPRNVSYAHLLGLIRQAAIHVLGSCRARPRCRLHAANFGRNACDAMGCGNCGLCGPHQLPLAT